jgi:menaquinone-specific isochorismate synthase
VSDLHAVVWRIDADLDPVAVAGDDGMAWITDSLSFAGRGVASTIGPVERADLAADVGDVLRAIPVERTADAAAVGPLALAALPYDRTAPATMVVPELLARRERDGTRWLVWTGTGDAPARDDALRALLDAPAPSPTPTRYAVTSARAPEDWCASVAAARDELRRGVARKVVLARDVIVRCDGPIARTPVLARLRRSFPSCYVFSLPTLIGASPELLVSRRGDIVRSQPMAGTTRRSPDPAVDARLAASLLASQKDRIEHQITIDVAHDTLLPWCSYLDAETEPSVVGVANVQHLATAVEGRLTHPLPSVLELVHALHPTPAVCGDPRDVATELIARHERMDRGSYAGPVGWVDAEGNGEFAVGLRSAEVIGAEARLFAGVGVVADSDPDAELDETRVKLEAMLGALVRP